MTTPSRPRRRPTSGHPHPSTRSGPRRPGKPNRPGPPRRSRRRRLVLIAGLALVLLTLLGLGGRADARPDVPTQPTPPAGCPGGPPGPAQPGTECPDGSVPAPAPTPCPGASVGGPPGSDIPCTDQTPPGPTTPTTPTSTPATAPTEGGRDDELAEQFALSGTGGPSLGSYDIGCDEGQWNAFLRKMWCGLTALPFSLGKWFVGTGTSLMDWALEFRVAESLTPVARTLSRAYETNFLGPLEIEDLAWTVALFVGGFHLLRARFADGAREIATTFIIAILGTLLLANPRGYLEGSIELAQNTSGAVLEAVDSSLNGNDRSEDATATRERVGSLLQRSFVAEPYDLINWGGPLTGECAAARDEILAGGPWAGDEEPREIMRQRGCEEAAAFNARATDNRAVNALTVGIASGLVMVLIIVLAIAVFAAQMTLIVLFAGASLAWTIALFPGGRSILWWWLSRLVWAVLITVTSIFLLSWIAVTVTALLENTSDVTITQRSFMMIVIVAVAYKFRSSVDRAIDGASSRIAATMNSITSGRPAGASSAQAARGPLSFSPTQTAITAAGAGASVTAAAMNLARSNAERARAVGSGAATATRGASRVGSGAARGAKAVVMAPVTLPQRYGLNRVRASQRSDQVRDRLNEARATRAQWARNLRHPISAAREGRAAAERATSELREWM